MNRGNTQAATAYRLREKYNKGVEKSNYGKREITKDFNISSLLENHQNVLAVFLLDAEHPISKAARNAVEKERNAKAKAQKNRPPNPNQNKVLIKIPGGGKATMYTYGSRQNHSD